MQVLTFYNVANLWLPCKHVGAPNSSHTCRFNLLYVNCLLLKSGNPPTCAGGGNCNFSRLHATDFSFPHMFVYTKYTIYTNTNVDI